MFDDVIMFWLTNWRSVYIAAQQYQSEVVKHVSIKVLLTIDALCNISDQMT